MFLQSVQEGKNNHTNTRDNESLTKVVMFWITAIYHNNLKEE